MRGPAKLLLKKQAKFGPGSKETHMKAVILGFLFFFFLSL